MGCFWGWRDNNSYVSGATSSGQSLSSRFDNVFDEKAAPVVQKIDEINQRIESLKSNLEKE